MINKKSLILGNILKITGAVSITGSLFFIVSTMMLGFVQPGYDHIIDTISVLVLGKYGWIQNINFIILAISFCFLGIGLGMFFYKKYTNSITIGFFLIAGCLLIDVLFKADPIDRTQIRLNTFHSQEGFIHLLVTFIMVILIPLFFIDLIRKLNQAKAFRPLSTYTLFVIITNFVFGLLWFYCRRNGFGFEIKGIWQKGIVLNVLIWMMIIGKWLYKQGVKKLI